MDKKHPIELFVLIVSGISACIAIYVFWLKSQGQPETVQDAPPQRNPGIINTYRST